MLVPKWIDSNVGLVRARDELLFDIADMSFAVAMSHTLLHNNLKKIISFSIRSNFYELKLFRLFFFFVQSSLCRHIFHTCISIFNSNSVNKQNKKKTFFDVLDTPIIVDVI